MKIKTKVKGLKLLVTVKTSGNEFIDEKELDRFGRIFIRGFLQPKLSKLNQIDYSGPAATTLTAKLLKPISKRDFLYIVEQIIVAIQKLQSNSFPVINLYMDPRYTYINETTREVQFLYIPLKTPLNNSTLMNYIESIVASVRLAADEPDQECVHRFINFFRNLRPFDIVELENYIMREDRSVVASIRKQNAGQSGFMTNKQIHYVEHYENQQAGPQYTPPAPEAPQYNPAPVVPAYTPTPESPAYNPVAEYTPVPEAPQYSAPNPQYIPDEEKTGLLMEEGNAPYIPQAPAFTPEAPVYTPPVSEAPVFGSAPQYSPAPQFIPDEEKTGLLMEEGNAPYIPQAPAFTPNAPVYTPPVSEAPVFGSAPQFIPDEDKTGLLMEEGNAPYIPQAPAFTPEAPVYTPPVSEAPVFGSAPQFIPDEDKTGLLMEDGNAPYIPQAPAFAPEAPVYTPPAQETNAQYIPQRAQVPDFTPAEAPAFTPAEAPAFVPAPQFSGDDDRTGLLMKDNNSAFIPQAPAVETPVYTPPVSEVPQYNPNPQFVPDDDRTGLLMEDSGPAFIPQAPAVEAPVYTPPIQQTPIYTPPVSETPAYHPPYSDQNYPHTTQVDDYDGSDETTLLNENQGDYNFHSPRLVLIRTQETAMVNKPVFRIGKEKSYVDFFVSNNPAVSRSHADIITRGNRHYIIDLNSKNHTYINGCIIPAQFEMEIYNGDKVRLGNEDFIFYT